MADNPKPQTPYTGPAGLILTPTDIAGLKALLGTRPYDAWAVDLKRRITEHERRTNA